MGENVLLIFTKNLIRDFLTKFTLIFMIFTDCGLAYNHGNHYNH